MNIHTPRVYGDNNSLHLCGLFNLKTSNTLGLQDLLGLEVSPSLLLSTFFFLYCLPHLSSPLSFYF